MKEIDIQRQILDYLAAKGILAFRMNTGAMSASYGGKKRFLRFGVPGMADVLAFPQMPAAFIGARRRCEYGTATVPIWIEVKAAKGAQSPAQKSFQAQVEAHGHRYIVARSLDDVIALLEKAA